MKNPFQGWGQQLPVYTTRPSANNGETSSYWLAGWIAALILYILPVNIILWGSIGVYEAIRFIA